MIFRRKFIATQNWLDESLGVRDNGTYIVVIKDERAEGLKEVTVSEVNPEVHSQIHGGPA